MFKDFYYPDGSKPEWKAINVLQRLFMKWFNKERTKVLLTFPVNFRRRTVVILCGKPF